MKIPIKKYEMDPNASWEERYRKLEAHHLEETTYLLRTCEILESQIKATTVSFKIVRDALAPDAPTSLAFSPAWLDEVSKLRQRAEEAEAQMRARVSAMAYPGNSLRQSLNYLMTLAHWLKDHPDVPGGSQTLSSTVHAIEEACSFASAKSIAEESAIALRALLRCSHLEAGVCSICVRKAVAALETLRDFLVVESEIN